MPPRAFELLATPNANSLAKSMLWSGTDVRAEIRRWPGDSNIELLGEGLPRFDILFRIGVEIETDATCHERTS